VQERRPALKSCRRRAGGILKTVPAPVCVRGGQRAGDKKLYLKLSIIMLGLRKYYLKLKRRKMNDKRR